MKRLICLFPVLFENRQYEPGEELPTHNAGYVESWTGNGTAEWREDTEEPEAKPKKRAPKAKAVTAPAGVTGEAIPATGSEPDLVGKVPSGKARGATPEPAKRGRKRSD